MMRFIALLFLLPLLLSCTQSSNETAILWPGDDQIRVVWQLVDDAVEGDNKRTSSFTISNEGDTAISGSWQLYFSQLPTTFYLPPEAENQYDIEAMGGDLYRIVTLDSFPDIPSGGSQKLVYQWPVGMVKKTHCPHGLFFVLGDGTVHNVHSYELEPIPTSLTFDKNGKKEPIYISAEKRFDQYKYIEDVPTDKLSPIIPTPQEIRYDKGNFALKSGLQILHDRGLENEANNLAETLNQVLQSPVVVGSTHEDEDNNIYLRYDSSESFASKEAYQLKIQENRIHVLAPSAAGIFYGVQSLKALIPAGFYKVPADQIVLPALSVSDSPRYAYRGQHLDVARNFQGVESIKKIIRLMGFYKLNKLHFHITDDEGWRLEIPGLPELTDIGAKRGLSEKNEPMLPPAYGSGGIADEQISSGTGYYTKSQFIDLLRFATQHHIEVIPEINGPGHARAAIVAMRARYEHLMSQGKESDARAYLLSDLNDASKYTSAQNYHDNVICVCQEYTYTFLEKVISEVVAMYREADAPLNIIHTGGDEVPQGAWTGSPECSRFIKDEANLNSVDDLHPYFVRRYLEIAQKYDLKIAGWEEITLKHTEEGNVPNPEFLNKGVISYAWNAIVGGGGEDMAYQLANLGYKVVMCNASNLYFDLAYTYEPDEPGLFWAGYIDTKNAFELTPSNIFLSILQDELGNPLDGITLSKDRIPLRPGAEENILGIQGALWSETLKNNQMVEYSLLPKMLGLAERAWAAAPPWANANSRLELKRSIDHEWSKFTNRVGKLELPRLDYLSDGYFYRISPPGAKFENGKLYINSEYPGLQLRYTTDGTDPHPFSTEYQRPVEIPANTDIIKVRAFSSNGRASRLVEVQVDAALLN